jgi:hypothetical protein
MTTEVTVLDTVEETKPRRLSLLEFAKDLIEEEDALLADLVAKEEPEDEAAFRLERRAEWRALAGLEELDFLRSHALFLEDYLRAAAEHNPERAERLADLMRKITA